MVCYVKVGGHVPAGGASAQQCWQWTVAVQNRKSAEERAGAEKVRQQSGNNERQRGA